MIEIKSVICEIFRHFKILPPEDGLKTNGIFVISKEKRNEGRTKWDPLMSAALTLKSYNGIHIRLENR